MVKFVVRRIGGAFLTVLVVVTATFFFVRLAPGGPFDSEKAVTPEILANLNKHYHLDDPLYKQYFDYLARLAQGDLGPSFKFPGRTVNELFMEGFPITVELGFYAILFALLIGVTVGVSAALKPNTTRDYVPMSLAMFGICVPTLLLGPLLVLVCGIWFEIFPVTGWDSTIHKILPSITLGAAYVAFVARLSRGGMLEIMAQDFIRTARAKGVSEAMVVIKHGLKGGLLPVVSFLGPAVTGLLSGSFVVETVFQIPGTGRFYVQAAFNRDYTMILGGAIIFAILIIFFNLLSDLIAVKLNPRLSYETQENA